MQATYDAAEARNQKTIDALNSEFATIRAGRATPAIVDKVMVEYYGQNTPINQMAAISVPEARMLVISPWDASTLKSIEKAIIASDIGITPSNDGKVIRLNFPPLTEERRRDLVKQVHKTGEDSKVAVRNVRRDTLETYKAMKKKSEITEDDLKDCEKDIQNLTDTYIKKIDDIVAAKEKELMEL